MKFFSNYLLMPTGIVYEQHCLALDEAGRIEDIIRLEREIPETVFLPGILFPVPAGCEMDPDLLLENLAGWAFRSPFDSVFLLLLEHFLRGQPGSNRPATWDGPVSVYQLSDIDWDTLRLYNPGRTNQPRITKIY